MLMLMGSLLIFVAAVQNGHTAPTTSTGKPEKPLFVPSVRSPTAAHSTLYGAETASIYSPQIRNNPDVLKYSDLLQTQPSYPSFERVLQNFLYHRGENRKQPQNANPIDDEDDKRKANNLQFSEQLSTDFEDLDRKYKRSTTYVSWSPPRAKTSTVNLERGKAPALNSHAKTSAVNLERGQAPTLNSRAVNERPFPYTTWEPYDDSPTKKLNLARRRRHDNEGNDSEDENRDNTLPLFQYAPAYNTYTFPGQFEPYHMSFVRDMPLQYSIVYEPAYRPSENLAWLTNSLSMNPNSAHADDAERFPATY